jgi:propionyl-CoA carboxylase alpha chain
MTGRPVTRVLVANRGEIARRVIATCHRLGLTAVAVCADPDLDAPHVREADAAVRLPGASPADTYLRGDLLVAAALAARADAVHPGYGFLSENAGFARAVTDAGLTWVGPSPAAIEAMGAKIGSKALVAAAGVPVLTSLDPAAVTGADLPVLVKASAGGGGRGMRVVRTLDDLPGALAAAGAEAAAAFGDPAVFIEPYLEHGHHVEVQLMADEHGTVLVLGERECSIQRRHQKVIEEAPSPLVSRTPGLRGALAGAAIAVARCTGYTGAGTVEFLARPDGRFWFLEMNTRLQVEHPVTECTTGLDLVEWQLLVAAGGALPALAPEPAGAAIEARLYAEDPGADWRPAAGTLHRLDITAGSAFAAPAAPSGVRLDSGVADGAVIGVHYDPLLAKVIAWAPTRAQAAAVLARTLAGATIHGPQTNRDLLVRVLRHPAFTAGETDTRFLDRSDLTAPLAGPADERLAAIAAALAGAAHRRAGAAVLAGLPSGWRNVPASPQHTVLTGPSGSHEVDYRFTRDGVLVDRARVLSVTPGSVLLEADGLLRRWRVTRYPGDDRLFADGDAGAVTFTVPPRFAGPAGAGPVAAGPGSLRAPMPGVVAAVRVAVGDRVEAGQELLVLEAMKMQHAVRAGQAGLVGSLPVPAGRTVDAGTVLVVLTEVP